MIKITAKEDFRCFKAGDSYEIEFPVIDSVVYMVGRNGSGKSTLVEAIRCMRNDNPGKESIALHKHLLKDKFEIEGLEKYEKVIHLSSTVDDTISFYNASSATDFVDYGGFWLAKKSHGERMSAQVAKFIKDIESVAVEGKTLIIFDEIDRGMEIRLQMGMHNLYHNVSLKYMADVLVISHNPIQWLLNKEVYDIVEKKVVKADNYILTETGVVVQVGDFELFNVNNKDKMK